MKTLVFDTNIVSTIQKVAGLDSLKATFPNCIFIIPPAVESELKKAGLSSYDFEVKELSSRELEIVTDLSQRHNSLGLGELQCMALSINKGFPCFTNDRKACFAALKEGVSCWNLPEILRAMLLKGVLTREELKDLIDNIENKDNIVFRNKERIYL